ncbi:MAG: hypothetical protein AAGA74_20515 [Pseudomonadota bacterium]
MNMYVANRSWSDQFLPQIQRIVGAHLLQNAPDVLDWHEATDLVMLGAKDMRIAARVRRPGFAERFPNHFTVRTETRSGGETELTKIVNGCADWMFYGHADPCGGLDRWWILDLRAFRAGLIRHATNGTTIRYGDRKNADGTAFRWFDITSFPKEPPLVVGCSG